MHLIYLILPIFYLCTPSVCQNAELKTLLEIKSALDPHGTYLSSWTVNGNPCVGPTFEGVACNADGKVANISLQGKGLDGVLPSAIGKLKNLTGLYLHFNKLTGEIPKEISELNQLTDLYLDVNNFTGSIPQQLGDMSSLQVLQLCYNKLSGNVPTRLGSLKKLNVLALQYNQLTGAIPASLGDLSELIRLDISFNSFFGSIPVKLAEARQLRILDVRNNTLSGNVPSALQRLKDGFQYENNPGLCGAGFASLRVCTESDYHGPNTLEPFAAGSNGFPKKDIPESANLQSNCSKTQCSNHSKGSHIGIDYLHNPQSNKPALVHQNISAEKVLIDWRLNPLLVGSGLHKLLADDMVFSMLKACAAMGYLAPEYTTTGKFTEKSDMYAFGILVLQILSGKTRIDLPNRQATESEKFAGFIDPNLRGKFCESEAIKLSQIALLCTHELPLQRPTINAVRQELSFLDESS